MKYTQNMWFGRFVINTSFALYDRSTEGGALCKLRTRSVAGGCWWQSSFRLPTPRTSVHSKQWSLFQDSRHQQETRSKYTCRRDSKRSDEKKPDIGKWRGVGPTHKNLRLTPNRCFLLAAYTDCRYICCCSGIELVHPWQVVAQACASGG